MTVLHQTGCGGMGMFCEKKTMEYEVEGSRPRGDQIEQRGCYGS